MDDGAIARTGEAGLAAAAAGQWGLVTRTQAVRLGCDGRVLARLCRDGQLERVARGVYRFLAVPDGLEQRCLAACLAAKGSVVCGLAAARLYGFEPVGGRVADGSTTVEVLAAAHRHRPAAGTYTVRYARALAKADRTTRHGIPVTAPARTLLDVAPAVTAEVLERFIGHLLATRAVRPGELAQLANKLRSDRPTYSRPGAAALRRALERSGMVTVPDSVLEHRALRLLRAAGLPDPEAQWAIRDATGHLVAKLDFAWPAERVGLEVDGYRWHSDHAAFVRDRQRLNRLQELGWRVYQTSFAELEAGAGDLLRQVRTALGPAKAAKASLFSVVRPEVREVRLTRATPRTPARGLRAIA